MESLGNVTGVAALWAAWKVGWQPCRPLGGPVGQLDVGFEGGDGLRLNLGPWTDSGSPEGVTSGLDLCLLVFLVGIHRRGKDCHSHGFGMPQLMSWFSFLSILHHLPVSDSMAVLFAQMM